MFRIIPNGCTRRQMKRLCRAGPCLKKSRGDPPHLRLVDLEQRFIEFEEMEMSLIKYSQKKESKS
jgi:hypothetical protein